MTQLANYSVLMSVYSKEDPNYFRAALNSLYAQTWPASQFVIVCDGPLTDHLETVIKEAKNILGERLNLIRLEKNQGLAIALATGLLACDNDFIMRADSDDISVPKRAEIQFQKMVDNGLDLISSDVSNFDENPNQEQGYRALPTDQKSIEKFAKTRSPFNHPAVCFKKTAVLKAGNYQVSQYCEDWHLWIRMIQSGARVGNIPSPLVHMRFGDATLARRSNMRAYYGQVALFKYMRDTHFISRIHYCKIRFLYWGQLYAPKWVLKLVYKKRLHNGRRPR